MSFWTHGLWLVAQIADDPGKRMISGLGVSFPVVWTIAVGILLGLLCVAAIYLVMSLVSRDGVMVLEELIFDGLFKPVFYVCLVPAGLALLTAFWAPANELWQQTKQLAAFRGSAAPDAKVMVTAALVVLVIFLVSLALRLLFPKVAAVAYTTGKEGMSQPLFYVVISVVAFLMLVCIWIPYYTFGDDIKVFMIQALELLTPFAILLAVSAASISVAQEIEGRTALTVLSKPIGRRQFVVGKLVGVVGPVLVYFLVLGLVFLATVSYKSLFEASESGSELSPVDCRNNVMAVAPGLLLRFMEAICFAAISVAVSTRLPMLANFAICAGIYVVGHLVPMVVVASKDKFVTVHFMGQLMATVLPVLEYFDLQTAFISGRLVSPAYLLTAGVYCLLYCTFVLCAALFLFEDRDLA